MEFVFLKYFPFTFTLTYGFGCDRYIKNDPLAWCLQQGPIPELGNKEKKREISTREQDPQTIKK